MTTRMHRPSLTLLAGAALLVAGAARPAAAQSASGCSGEACARVRERGQLTQEQRERMERTRRALEGAVDRARQRIEELRTSELYRNDDDERALRQARLALERAEPTTPEFAMQIARLQELAAREQVRLFEDQELKSALKDVTRLQSELFVQRFPRVRRGWLGVSFASERRVDRNGRVTFTVEDYPEIVSVEPESPAERAGVRRGDLLLAMNGRDVVRQGPIPLSDLLVPGETLRLRVRREGRSRDMNVRVGEQQAQVGFHMLVTPDGDRIVTSATPVAPLPPGAYEPPGVVVRPRAPRATPAPRPPDAPQPMIYTFEGPGQGAIIVNSAFLGAEIRRLDDDQREILDVDAGVLVVSVAPGTPAARAGLRSFDVVRRVGATRVQTPDELRRAIARLVAEDEGSAELTIVSKRKEKKVSLRWKD
jgi:hypothetical protein